ncbi:MAG: glycosyltransferase [Patescibacteria group bacterium]
MKVAIVHDNVGEFGGAERVVLALSEMFPDAPIYTAFKRKGPFLDRLKGRKIIASWAQNIPFFSTKLHSPLRFLAPWIWGSFDFSKYELVISSASWYITKGFGSRNETRDTRHVTRKPVEICYIHTPPRWLYGYDTPLGDRNIFVKIYKNILAHFLRIYDFEAAQRVNYFVANSENVAARVEKFYRREAIVIYPPIEIPNSKLQITNGKKDYYLIISRITGGKGIEMAVRAAKKLKIKMKIAGGVSGYSQTHEWLKKNAVGDIEYLGYVTDEEQAKFYSEAKAFLALERDVDFGMTPVEAMVYGAPVIAYNSGGYSESVIDATRDTRHATRSTGVLFEDYTVEGLVAAIKRFEKIKFDEDVLRGHAKKFSKERFKKEILGFVKGVL